MNPIDEEQGMRRRVTVEGNSEGAKSGNGSSADSLAGNHANKGWLATVPRWVITTASVIVFLVGWQIGAGYVNPIMLAPPSKIVVAFVQLSASGVLWPAVASSLSSFLVGFALAILIGIPLGLLIGTSRTAESGIGIYITAGYAAPMVAFVPLLTLWFGLGFTVKAVVVFVMALFPVCINTWLGVKAVPKELTEVGRAFVAPRSVIIRRIVLPATLPSIMAGIKLSGGRAVIGVVIAEFFTAISGLGGVIINASSNFETARMFVPIVILMLLALVVNRLVTIVAEIVAPWQKELASKQDD